MDNYYKEPSFIEHIVDSFPFDNPESEYVRVEVLQEKSVKITLNKTLKVFGPLKPVVWFAEGRAISKAVSCAEIIKTYFKQHIYQITKISQIRTVERWEPLLEVAEGLDPLQITRSVPMMHILISLEPLDKDALGYQKSFFRDQIKTISMLQLENDNESLPVEDLNLTSNSLDKTVKSPSQSPTSPVLKHA